MIPADRSRKRLSLEGAGLSNCRHIADNERGAGTFVPKHTKPHTKPPAIPSCLPADDGRVERSTSLIHQIEGGHRFAAVDHCCGLWARYPLPQVIWTKLVFLFLFFCLRNP